MKLDRVLYFVTVKGVGTAVVITNLLVYCFNGKCSTHRNVPVECWGKLLLIDVIRKKIFNICNYGGKICSTYVADSLQSS